MFLEVVRSSDFGACGVCGSIGWAQRIEPGTHTERQLEDKRRLARKLDRLIPCARFGQDVPLRSRWKFRFLRAFVPHGDVDPRAWVELIGREVDLIGS